MDDSMLGALHVCPVCYYHFVPLVQDSGDDAVELGRFVRSVARHLDGHPPGEWLPALLAAQQVPTVQCPRCLGHGVTVFGHIYPSGAVLTVPCSMCTGRGRVPAEGSQ